MLTDISLRDYFAVHCEEPCHADLAAAANMQLGSAPGWYDRRTQDPVIWILLGSGSVIQFKDWWASLSVKERAFINAKARYIVADAMIEAQTAVDPTTPELCDSANDLAKVALILNPLSHE